MTYEDPDHRIKSDKEDADIACEQLCESIDIIDDATAQFAFELNEFDGQAFAHGGRKRIEEHLHGLATKRWHLALRHEGYASTIGESPLVVRFSHDNPHRRSFDNLVTIGQSLGISLRVE